MSDPGVNHVSPEMTPARNLIAEIKKNIRNKVHEQKPGPDCLSDKQILDYMHHVGDRSPYSEKDKHMTQCPRCYTRAHFLKEK